jgi:hypothetical protein
MQLQSRIRSVRCRSGANAVPRSAVHNLGRTNVNRAL